MEVIQQYKMSQCSRPGEVAMVFDGCQQSIDAPYTFDAQACSDQLLDSTLYLGGPGANKPNQPEPMDPAKNVDGSNSVGLIRWRITTTTARIFSWWTDMWCRSLAVSSCGVTSITISDCPGVVLFRFGRMTIAGRSHNE